MTTSDRAPTKGEFRVGISFNPSANPVVDQIKRMAADLIDGIEEIPDGKSDPNVSPLVQMERARLKAIAQTHIEDAAMWAVKAATKGT